MSATTASTTNTDNATTRIVGATTNITTDTNSATTEPRTRFWRVGLAAGAVASVATTLVVLAARAADVDIAVDGEQIPLAGFAQFTMIGALIGVALASVLSRRAHDPRTMFLRTTVALTALSIVPDFVVPATADTRFVLVLTHVVAAVIIVPALAARLRD